MEPKEAVTIAKKHLVEIFSGENLLPPTLEEIWFEPDEGVWNVTLGVRRLIGEDNSNSVGTRLGLTPLPQYKLVQISEKDGHVISIKHRFSPASAL
jgi:hypothetical protein